MTATADETAAPPTPVADAAAPADAAPSGGDRAPVVRRVLVIAVVLAAVAAAVSGALWAFAATSGSLAMARDRDAVLADARQAAINLNTLDYRNVAAGLDLWQQSSTGQVLAEFQQNRDQYAKLVQESRRTTVATVPDAAVTELDEHAGVARVLVAVDVTVTPEGQAPAVTRQRLQMEMTRTPAGWKVSLLSPVRSPAAGTGN
jgi:Mce-associated membrane protein